jgi:NitT/TauT family transport system permease protein
VNQPLFRRIWGGATGWLDRPRKMGWTDLIFLLVVVALAMGIFNAAQEWGAPRDARIEPTIDLSPWYLPLYTFYSLMRGLIAYALSLVFTLVYGYWAAKDRVAQRVLVPLLDILQSIPVLGFAPSLILVFVALFPHNNVGLEIAAIIAIFTGQAWNMTFSFYQSVRSVPADMQEAATVYRFSWWQRFRWVELPFSTIGLIWNSMMSMAGGWFFLATVEGLEFGGKKYWLPGIGSYIHAASTGDHWNWQAIGLGVLSMVLMIVALDQLLWRPVVAWAKKFRVEEGGEQEEATSWFLDWLRRSRLIGFLGASIGGLFHRRERQGEKAAEIAPTPVDPTQQSSAVIWLSRGLFFVLTGVLIYGAWQLVRLVMAFGEPGDWAILLLDAFRTLGRVLIAVAVGTIWTVPVGLAIGLSARLSRHLQSVVQVLASFPSPLLFPLVILCLQAATKAWGGRENDPTVLEWGSVFLMLLGTQWYILFNVIAGAMAIPADLKEAARSYNITGWQRFWVLYFPALFPYLVTGWVTAAGGAWNASILAEWDYGSSGLVAHGLGADIMEAAAGWKHPGQEPTAEAVAPAGPEASAAPDEGASREPPANYPMLAAAVLIMSTVVVLFNRAVWRQLYALAEKRFSITR